MVAMFNKVNLTFESAVYLKNKQYYFNYADGGKPIRITTDL